MVSDCISEHCSTLKKNITDMHPRRGDIILNLQRHTVQLMKRSVPTKLQFGLQFYSVVIVCGYISQHCT